MIQIPLTADLHIEKGEKPLLEFQDRKELEIFISYLQKQVEIIQGKRKERLEYFSDGIYFDGEFLELRRKHFEILKAFEFVDKMSKTDLIYKVWNNSLIKESTIAVTISQFNSIMLKYDIFISFSDGYYTIHIPT